MSDNEPDTIIGMPEKPGNVPLAGSRPMQVPTREELLEDMGLASNN